MRHIFILFSLLVLASSTTAQRLSDIYKPGDEWNYAVESGGKVIGTQHAKCQGWKTNGVDSLLVFAMDTKSIFTRGGKTFDLNVNCEVGYSTYGLPVTYEYSLDLMNAKVSQSGVFNDSGYTGRTSRIGVSQPVSYRTRQWPLLFDNNFALQWEIALRLVQVPARDSVAYEVVIPQLNQAMVFKFSDAPSDLIVFDGQQMSARGVKVDPANQMLYFDPSGRLLEAYDPVQKTTIRLLPQGEKAEIATASWFDTFMKRLPILFVLFVFALFWLAVMARKNWKRLDIAVLFVAGAALYWLSLEALAPLQNLYLGAVLNPQGSSGGIYLVLLGSAFLFAVVEELAKFIALLARSFVKAGHGAKLGIALGAACGAGFALAQAANLLQFTPTGGAAAPVELVQKFFLVGLNATTGALIGFIIMGRLSAGYYLIPIGLKTLFNWLAVFVQKGSMLLPMYSFLSFVISAVAIGILFILYQRHQRQHAPQKSGRRR